MFKLSAKSALMCAVFPIGLFASGCGGLGSEGFHNVVAGNWPAAKVNFTDDYQGNPEHPITVFNMGATHAHDGDRDAAADKFHEAVIRGQNRYAYASLEPEGAGVPIAEMACTRLHRDNRLDANCGDTIVARVEPPPAPVAQAEPEPAPAMAAQATVAEPPKQARH